MAIATLDQYIGAAKYRLTWMRTGTRTLIAAMPYTVIDIAGSPGPGALRAIRQSPLLPGRQGISLAWSSAPQFRVVSTCLTASSRRGPMPTTRT
jgi:hypothetical protein